MSVGRKACFATMPKAAMELVDGSTEGIIPVYKVGAAWCCHFLFSSVTYMSDRVGEDGIIVRAKLSIQEVEPLQGLKGLVDICPSPTMQWFHGDGVRLKMMSSPIFVTRGGNRHTLMERVEAGLCFEFLDERLTPRF